VINGMGRHAGSDSAPRKTGKVNAISAGTRIIERTGPVDIPLSAFTKLSEPLSNLLPFTFLNRPCSPAALQSVIFIEVGVKQ
jgi:hypothetical protein